MSKTQNPGCLIGILQLAGLLPSKSSDTDEFPYTSKEQLLTKAEKVFFGRLEEAVASKYRIFAMVRLADLIQVEKGTEKWQSYFNKIQSKHIDFILCDLDNIKPVLAIELDDASHQREDRKKRDEFLEGALNAARLPLLRVPVKRDYDVEVLRNSIEAFNS
ncbi:MAG: DUF2726 domain-containing protein [Lentisphaeria bacterium]|nr:DUF2726 domain-containing protein [Lentisphaeria bacterium]NQZ70675.1 DUF2726 domain-containing protein [Lentisphaeria bacterium]